MIVLPVMPAEQTASWLGILDLYDRLNEGWTLIGGQLVHLHCAERGEFPVRPTNDADTVIDVRADPTILHTFTKTLEDLGFTAAGISAEGRQHRWTRGEVSPPVRHRGFAGNDQHTCLVTDLSRNPWDVRKRIGRVSREQVPWSARIRMATIECARLRGSCRTLEDDANDGPEARRVQAHQR